MKRIVLIRHAKSSYDEDDQPDLERPLNQRGRVTAPVVAAWLEEHGFVPDFVWLSPAERSKQTWERMASLLAPKAKTEAHDAIYMADPRTLLEVLKITPEKAKTVALIGHQPGLSSAVRKLANGKEKETLSRAYTKFPTAAAAVLEADVKSWGKLAFNEAVFRRFVVPKELI